MLYRGKTLEEALIIAEEDLGISREDFLYEFSEKKLGFFKKEVEIKVEITNKLKAEIINGEFIFHSGVGKVKIIPNKNCTLKVNGNNIYKNIDVDENDSIEILPNESPSKREFDIDIIDKGFKAILNVTLKPKTIYNVVNHSISDVITIETEESILENAPEITIDDVKQKLLEKEIKYGINFGNLKDISEGKVLIAEGRLPVKSIRDEIIYYFNTNDKRKTVEVNGKVDYYNIEEIESVEEGFILAELKEGVEGEKGVNIFGKTIEVDKKKTLTLKVGNGAEISEDGKTVKAVINGKPCLIGDKICVIPVYEVNGDADLKIGNIEFDGDILIKGNVKEGMKISAGRNMTIESSVLESSLHSKGSINIKGNLIASVVKAGNIQINELKYIEVLKKIKNFLSEAIDAVDNAHNILPKKYQVLNKCEIFKKIIDSKYIKEKLLLTNTLKEYPKLKLSLDIKNLLNEIFSVYQKVITYKDAEFSEIVNLSKNIEKFLETYEIKTTNSDVFIGYCQNSKIESSNNVYITGKGCYCTDIKAEGEVVINGFPGTYRSGSIYAKKGVYIKEIGSSAGIKSIIKTESFGQIKADTVYHNTLFIVGNYNYYVDEPIKNVNLYVKDGELVIEKFRA